MEQNLLIQAYGVFACSLQMKVLKLLGQYYAHRDQRRQQYVSTSFHPAIHDNLLLSFIHLMNSIAEVKSAAIEVIKFSSAWVPCSHCVGQQSVHEPPVF